MAVTFAPHLGYLNDAEEAARFYTSVIPNSSFDRITALPVESPSGPAGSVHVVEFTLAGAPVMAISAGLHEPFNDAVSLMLLCDTQDEIDALWTGLISGGGYAVACGWLKDKYGVSWQVTPKCLGEMISNADRERAARATAAMMGMVKFDIAKLQAAFDG